MKLVDLWDGETYLLIPLPGPLAQASSQYRESGHVHATYEKIRWPARNRLPHHLLGIANNDTGDRVGPVTNEALRSSFLSVR